jgi:hypothetical protein
MARLIVVEDLAAPAVCGRGGHSMFVAQILHGLARLGHEVLFVEYLQDDPEEQAVAYFEKVVKTWSQPERSALLLEPTGMLHVPFSCLYRTSRGQWLRPWPRR